MNEWFGILKDKTRREINESFSTKPNPKTSESVTGDSKQINNPLRILSHKLSMKLYSAPGSVALQAGGNKPTSCQERFPKTFPCYVHCKHCQKKIYEKTYECCLFMLYLTQRCKENIIRKDDTVKEQFGEVFLFYPQNDFHLLMLATAHNIAVFASQDGNLYPCKYQSGVNTFSPTVLEHPSTWYSVQV